MIAQGIVASSVRDAYQPPLGSAYIPRTASNWIQNPAADSFTPTSTLTLTARIALELPLPGNCSIAECWLTTGNRWIWRFGSTNMISLLWFQGGATQTRTTTTAWPYASATWGWLRTTLTLNNGSSQHVVRNEYSGNGINWTLLQADIVTGGVASVDSVSSTLTVGNRGGTPGALGLKGWISDLIVQYDGVTRFAMDLSQDLKGVSAAATNFYVSSGQYVSVSRSGSPALVLYPPP